MLFTLCLISWFYHADGDINSPLTQKSIALCKNQQKIIKPHTLSSDTTTF